jgi:hypothetical protein
MKISGALGGDGEVKFRVHLEALNGKTKTVDAMLDTGGPFSLITISLAKDLGLKTRRKVKLQGANAVAIKPAYYLYMKMNNSPQKGITLVECNIEDSEFVVIGRSILKKWDIDYRGKLKSFEIRN